MVCHPHQPERHPEPGFSRVKDLARSGAALWVACDGRSVNRVPAAPRQIVHGLKTVQDDAIEIEVQRDVMKGSEAGHRKRFTHPGSRTCSSSSRCSRAAMIPGLPR